MAKKKTKTARTATEGLKILWEEGYFRTSRKQAAIVSHLAGRGNNFPGPEMGMGLKRARHLTRRGKRGAYEYIQKYPFIAEEEKSTPKKGA